VTSDETRIKATRRWLTMAEELDTPIRQNLEVLGLGE
jgi:hypothetical protein